MKNDNKKRCSNCDSCGDKKSTTTPLPFLPKPQTAGRLDIDRYGELNFPQCDQPLANNIAHEIKSSCNELKGVTLTKAFNYALSGYKSGENDTIFNNANAGINAGHAFIYTETITVFGENNNRLGLIHYDSKTHPSGHNVNYQPSQPNSNDQVDHISETYILRFVDGEYITFSGSYNQNPASPDKQKTAITSKSYQIFKIVDSSCKYNNYSHIVGIFDNDSHEKLLLRTYYFVTLN